MPAVHRCSTRRSPGAERPVSVPLCAALAAQRSTSSPASRPPAALDPWKWGLRSPPAGQADVGRAPVCEDAQSELESDAHVRDARGPDCPAPQPPSGLPPFAEREEGGMGSGGGRGGGGGWWGDPHAGRHPLRHGIPFGMVAIWAGTGNPDTHMQWTLVLAGAQGLPRRVRRPRALRRVLDRPADSHDEQSAAMRPGG